ncbi:methionyl-tRNA formyltransferase [Treponema bryantii]|uniref:Methionyl-tRNA formyltransferase n=1 Tax=Treponema bryantii TaxID=163 RepID=A0A1H8ZY15_9SPIR|nr:methionyl-tRNA formyltransferase [Treponema bryantii]SEP68648.1 methionyl-tRNA formyltransferase [Treponema bryantii]
MIRILFAGSPEAAKKTLEILNSAQSESGFEIAGVLSNPPTAKGRHKDLIPTPVAAFAESQGIPVLTPAHLDGEARNAVRPLKADLLVCFAYGHIFGPKFLELFPFGGINLHPSLLPKYRGCTPVPAAILNRDKQTAVTIQTLGLKMDEGDILEQTVVELNGTETGESLLNYSAEEGAKLILEVIKKCNSEGKLPEGRHQSGEASYTGIITKEDGRINWNESAEVIEAKIRAYYPEPGCWCMENDLPLRILEASVFSGTFEGTAGTVLEFSKRDGILIKTGDGILAVKKLQRQGKNAMDYKSFMNGARNFIGTVLV